MPLKETEVPIFKPNGDLSEAEIAVLAAQAKDLGAEIGKIPDYISSSSSPLESTFAPAGTKFYAFTSKDRESGEGKKSSYSPYFIDEKGFRQLEAAKAIDIENNMIDRPLLSRLLSLPANNEMNCLVAITTTQDQHFIATGVAPAIQLYQNADYELGGATFPSKPRSQTSEGGGRQVFCFPDHATDRPMPPPGHKRTPKEPGPQTIPIATEVRGIAQLYDLTDWRQPRMDLQPAMFVNESSLISHAAMQDVLETHFERAQRNPATTSPRPTSSLFDKTGAAPAPTPGAPSSAPPIPRTTSLRR